MGSGFLLGVQPETHSFHSVVDRLRTDFVSFIAVRQSLFEYHVTSLVQSVKQANRRCEGRVAVLDILLIHYEVKVVRPTDLLRLYLRPRLVANRDEGQTGRGHQTFLARSHANIDVPIVNRQLIPAKNRDRIHDQEHIMISTKLSKLLKRPNRYTGRGFVVDDCNCLSIRICLQDFLEILYAGRLTPF